MFIYGSLSRLICKVNRFIWIEFLIDQTLVKVLVWYIFLEKFYSNLCLI